MGNALQNFLEKYERKDVIFKKLVQNNETESEPLSQECLDSLWEKTINHSKDHTPEDMITLSKIFMKVDDFRLACEIIHCSASLAIQEFIVSRKLKVELLSQNGKRAFTRALSRKIGNQYAVFDVCHDSFFTNDYNAGDVNYAFVQLQDFIRQLREYPLTDEKRIELEKDNFNEDF